MIEKDLQHVRELLPDHYTVQESKTLGSIHCTSSIGIDEDGPYKSSWSGVFNGIALHFGSRFSEVFHNVCYRHTDFTIYLKNPE
jgi:hypothetical protein